MVAPVAGPATAALRRPAARPARSPADPWNFLVTPDDPNEPAAAAFSYEDEPAPDAVPGADMTTEPPVITTEPVAAPASPASSSTPSNSSRSSTSSAKTVAVVASVAAVAGLAGG